MQFSYFGATPTVATIASPLGTKAELAAWIRDNLITAGWSVLSGAGTGVVKLRSAATPHGLRCRLQINDTVDATSVRLYGISDDELSATPTGSFLFPTAGFNWKLVATPYYARIFRDIGSLQTRDCFFIDNLYIPAPDRGSITEAFYTSSNSTNVGNDATVQTHFRRDLHGNNTNDKYIVGFNGSRWVASGTNGAGSLAIRIPSHSTQGGSTAASGNGRKFWDNSFSGEDILFTWGTTSATDPALIRGIMPDAFLYADTIAYGTIWAIDGHSWQCVTFGNLGFSVFILIS